MGQAMSTKHIGSSIDEAEARAIAEVIAWQLAEAARAKAKE
jgi:hypothetical protein